MEELIKPEALVRNSSHKIQGEEKKELPRCPGGQMLLISHHNVPFTLKLPPTIQFPSSQCSANGFSRLTIMSIYHYSGQCLRRHNSWPLYCDSDYTADASTDIQYQRCFLSLLEQDQGLVVFGVNPKNWI